MVYDPDALDPQPSEFPDYRDPETGEPVPNPDNPEAPDPEPLVNPDQPEEE